MNSQLIKGTILLFFTLFYSHKSYCQFDNIDTIAINYGLARQVLETDINSDGNIDIVVLYNDHLVWYENDSTGFFKRGSLIFDNFNIPGRMDIGDLDSDGDADIAVCDKWNNDLFWLENNNLGEEFSYHLINGSISSAIAPSISDLDGDGDLDILVSGNNILSWYKNDGAATFSLQQNLPANACQCPSVGEADLDGDLDLDVIYVSIDNNEVGWHENLGAGVFGPAQTIASHTGAASLLIEDVDGDGNIDLVVGSTYAGGSGQTIRFYKNLGGAIFSTLQFGISGQGQYPEIRMIDYNNDGFKDLIFAESYYDNIIVYPSDGAGSFITTPTIHYTAIENSHTLAVKDFNNDGLEDIIYMEEEHLMMDYNLGNGNFAFQTSTTNYLNQPQKIEMADLDNDSDLDLIVISSVSKELCWYENLGGDIFSGKKTLDFLETGRYVKSADLDNDGDLDIVYGMGQFIKIIENLGGGVFDTPAVLTSSVAVRQICVADFNNDSKLDIVVNQYNPSILIFENLGGLNFSSPNTLLSGLASVENISIADMDLDGDIDLMASSGTDNKIVWYDNTSGSFGTYQIISSSITNPSYSTLADLNNNGLNDILFYSNNNDQLGWIMNLGQGVFSPENVLPISILYLANIETQDINNDGLLDIIAPHSFDLIWFENLGAGSFSNTPNISNVGQNHLIASADLDVDGDYDIIFGNSSQLSIIQNQLFSDTQIKGELYFDLDSNGVKDGIDYGSSLLGVFSTPLSDFTYTASDGKYLMNFSDTIGSYSIFPELLNYWSITTDSLTYQVNIDSNFNSMDSLDFGFYPDTLVDSLDVHLIGGFPRCNDEVNYWLGFTNKGTTVPSGIYSITLDDSLSLVSTSILPDSISGQTIYWHYDSLGYFQSQIHNIVVQMPDFMSFGDTLSSILSLVIDSLGSSNLFSANLDQVLLCAYDPNDKIASPIGIDLEGYIPTETPYIDYTIRFQNTGNDTSINVVIKDKFDANLELQSLQILSHSHPVSITVDQFGEAKFTFSNIYLPDSNVNFLESQGFIKFRLQLNPFLLAGTQINNTAQIFFDFNPAVITNTKTHTLYDCNSILTSLSINSINCQNEIIIGDFMVDPSATEFNWNINAIDSAFGSNYTWLADTSGNFDLNITIQTPFCFADSILNFNINAEVYGTSFHDSICNGDSLLIFNTYQNTANVYFDTLTSVISGCDSINMFNLIVNSNPLVTFSNLDDTLCLQEGPISLSANPGGGVFSGNGINTNEFDPNLSGTGDHQIFYTYTDPSSSCQSSESENIYVIDCLGLSANLKHEFTIQPNPFSENTILRSKSLIDFASHYKMYDLTGRLIYQSEEILSNEIIINRTTIPNGIIILELFDYAGASIFRERLIIQ